MALIIFLCIGALAGWIAGRLMKGSGFGLLGNMAVGIIGAVIGGWTFSQLGISVANGFIGSLVTSVAGASILLFFVGLFKK
uniref:GlsB/YeaQ/YmgE family stress response membrane protein n=1 Tax=Candidatus Electronema sp. TaxID=2698783 RepID=UPI0040579792